MASHFPTRCALRRRGWNLTRFRGEEADIAYIKELCEKNGVQQIVCGLPKNMNGTIGPQAEKDFRLCGKD